MSLFEPKPSALAEWYELVGQAQELAGYHFDDYLSNYLVLTLNQFTQKGELATSVIACDFLSGVEVAAQAAGGQKLRGVGDQCLLISGLFPGRALSRHVSLSYYVDIGRNAYYLLSAAHLKRSEDVRLYQGLSDNFVGLMDVLHCMRHQSNSDI